MRYPSHLHIDEDLEFTRRPGIYKCTCLEDEWEYVGQAKDLLRRKGQHLSELRHGRHYNKHLQRSWNLYGEDAFVWSIVEYCSVEELDEAEIYWIKQFDSFNHGYNQCEGGNSIRGYKQSPESCAIRAEAVRRYWTPENREMQRNRMLGEKNPMYGRTGDRNPAFGKDHSGQNGSMYGKRHTESAKEKNRQAHLGERNVNSIPVVCEETGEVFSSMGEAGRAKCCDSTTICRVCKGSKKTAGGYHWRYATDSEKSSY